jgi:glutaredoxin
VSCKDVTDDIEIVVYGATWCPDTVSALDLLKSNGIEYTWKDIEKDDDANESLQKILEVNGFVNCVTKRKIPVVIISNNGGKKHFVEHSDDEILDFLKTLKLIF